MYACTVISGLLRRVDVRKPEDTLPDWSDASPRSGDDGHVQPEQQTVADVGEFGLVDLVRERSGTNQQTLIGPGDDAAHVQTRDGTFVVSTDLLVEGRHFRRDWSSAGEIGRKAAAANLSDINAMGGVATVLTVGLGLPAGLMASWVTDLADGFETECALVGAHVVGGDVTAADQIVIAVTAMGDTVRPITRGGAAPGDVVAVAGTLGLAGAGFAALSRGFRSPKAAVDAHRVPSPPYAAGPRAADAGATAMIDVSDGLLADVGHVAQASNVVIDLESELFEVPEAVRTVAEALGADPLQFVLTGGDDYALVATFSAATDLPDGWTRIGSVRDVSAGEQPTVLVDGVRPEGPTGHRHWV
ncbi:thiamine-phosphate kinase [Aeromicrobium terrae]|uniref:Thiamine-monophosphate kinase n=1 Tax=Aeromicrobium terrae TaxID=2498846 RepID=A0A5C8NP74_9ACTN|nr:thiamine-phosphate kinase [Aeromicrobium terrae]